MAIRLNHVDFLRSIRLFDTAGPKRQLKVCDMSNLYITTVIANLICMSYWHPSTMQAVIACNGYYLVDGLHVLFVELYT
jgi:hypothetical protein